MTPLAKLLADNCNEWRGLENPLGRRGENASQVWGQALGEIAEKGEDPRQLAPLWRDFYRNILNGRRRSPRDTRANSHDNAEGDFCAMILLRLPEYAEWRLRTLIFGHFWPTSIRIDAEWWVRPNTLALLKIAAGKRPNWLENLALALNLAYSRSWNMKRMRILALERLPERAPPLSPMVLWGIIKGKALMGEMYKGREDSLSFMHKIWES